MDKPVRKSERDGDKLNKNNNMKTMNNSNTDGKALIVRARDCYKLMTNPRSKEDELSETSKSWLKEMAVEEVLGLRKVVDTKPMMKGTLCVHESIDLYNKVMTTGYKKNSMTKVKDGFSGTPNLLGNDCVIKITTSWDATTFPFFQDEVNKLFKKSGHDWQCRVYMMLFGKNRAAVSYCLVDTPTETPEGELLLNKWDDCSLHRFDGIVEAHKRVSTSEMMERDTSIEQKMLERYVVANRYYQRYLEELNNK